MGAAVDGKLVGVAPRLSTFTSRPRIPSTLGGSVSMTLAMPLSSAAGGFWPRASGRTPTQPHHPVAGVVRGPLELVAYGPDFDLEAGPRQVFADGADVRR